MGQNTKVLTGFQGSYAFEIDAQKNGDSTNVVVVHANPNPNHTMTDLVVDEYGGVDPSVLISIAHAYLRTASH